jgi:hypothetical protein
MLFYEKKLLKLFNNLLNKYNLFAIDRNFCSVHEEITSIRLYTPGNPYARVCTT